MCDEICFPSRITWWSGNFKMIYLQKVVRHQHRDKRKWISSQSQLIVRSPGGLLMRSVQLVSGLVSHVYSPVLTGNSWMLLWTFMVLYLFRTWWLKKKIYSAEFLACKVPDDWFAAKLTFFFMFFYSSIHSVYNAPGEPQCGQHHPLLVPAGPAQWRHLGLRTAVLWKGTAYFPFLCVQMNNSCSDAENRPFFFVLHLSSGRPPVHLHSSKSSEARRFWTSVRTSAHSPPITVMVSHWERKPQPALQWGRWGLMRTDLWLKQQHADWCKNSFRGARAYSMQPFIDHLSPLVEMTHGRSRAQAHTRLSSFCLHA